MRNLEALVLWTARGQRGKVREEGGVQSLRGRRRHSLQNPPKSSSTDEKPETRGMRVDQIARNRFLYDVLLFESLTISHNELQTLHSSPREIARLLQASMVALSIALSAPMAFNAPLAPMQQV